MLLVWHVCRQTFLKGHILIKFSCTISLEISSVAPAVSANRLREKRIANSLHQNNFHEWS